jgi:acetyl-CoA C-acetyltransferase
VPKKQPKRGRLWLNNGSCIRLRPQHKDHVWSIEDNEAFASVVLAVEKVLGLDDRKVNIHGGAIALGHPTGSSGSKLIVTLYHALKRTGGKLGLAALCGGTGVSRAIVIEERRSKVRHYK